MTIDKAIEVLTRRAGSPFGKANQDTLEAMKLGIEALDRIAGQRRGLLSHEIVLLPGETKK